MNPYRAISRPTRGIAAALAAFFVALTLVASAPHGHIHPERLSHALARGGAPLETAPHPAGVSADDGNQLTPSPDDCALCRWAASSRTVAPSLCTMAPLDGLDTVPLFAEGPAPHRAAVFFPTGRAPPFAS